MGKVIFTCFAGRRRYLEILSGYIYILLSKKLIDEVHMWDYTRNEEDSLWLRENWNECIMNVEDKSTYVEYYKYYSKERYPEDDTVLIKCDDDIVFIDIDEFENFIKNRRLNRLSLIMTACVINNPVCSCMLFQTTNLKPESENVVFFSPEHANHIHNTFLDGKIEKAHLKMLYFNLDGYKLNINFIAILSEHFEIISKNVGMKNDEDEINILLNRMNNPICMDSQLFVSHMAYTKQREDGFDETEFLEKYKIIKEQNICKYK